MQRRALLASVGAALGALAGCPGRATREPVRTVTPAPVPTDDERADFATAESTPAPVFQFPSSLGCPLLPRDADVYVCSPRAYPGGVELFPVRSRFVVGSDREAGDRLSFTLRNQSSTPFETRVGRWLLARNDPDGWNPVETGASETPLTVGPDEELAWQLGIGQTADEEAAQRTVTPADGGSGATETVAAGADATAAERTVRRAVPLDATEGLYSFGVHGFHDGGRLVALQAPFVLGVRGADEGG